MCLVGIEVVLDSDDHVIWPVGQQVVEIIVAEDQAVAKENVLGLILEARTDHFRGLLA